MRTNQLFIEFKTELLKIKDKKKFEKAYYEKLRKCLKAGKFIAFELLFNASVDFNLFIDIKKIPDRFNIISKLLLNCTDKVSTGYQTSALGEIIDILRFCKQYNLLEKQLSVLEKKTLKNLKKDTLFLANLNDLFGKVSNSFILYIYNVIPQDLYNHFITSSISFFPDRDELVHYIKNIFFDQYAIYGLSVRNLSSIDEFIKVFKEELLISKGKELIEFDITYISRRYYYDTEEEHEHRETKKHLVSPKNIIKNMNKILDKDNYNFYSLSMVLLGGLGPQGLGFTYSTPRGEVIEICSDQKESEAIIIKYKQYLKRKFLGELDKKLANLCVKTDTRMRLKDYLSNFLNPKDLISYNDKGSILKKIKKFLNDEFQYRCKSELEENIGKISEVFSIILRKKKKIWFKVFFKRRFFRRLEKEMTNLDIKSDIRKKINNLLKEILNPKDFFNYQNKDSILKET